MNCSIVQIHYFHVASYCNLCKIEEKKRQTCFRIKDTRRINEGKNYSSFNSTINFCSFIVSFIHTYNLLHLVRFVYFRVEIVVHFNIVYILLYNLFSVYVYMLLICFLIDYDYFNFRFFILCFSRCLCSKPKKNQQKQINKCF